MWHFLQYFGVINTKHSTVLGWINNSTSRGSSVIGIWKKQCLRDASCRLLLFKIIVIFKKTKLIQKNHRTTFFNFQLFENCVPWERVGTVPESPLCLHLVLLQQLASDDQPLNLTGPFVDFRDASVAVVPLGRHVCHVTHPAQDLDGLEPAEQTL